MVGALSAMVLVIAGAAGCGSSDGYDNASRPPAMLTLSVEVTNSRVSVSPAHIGAGPVVLLIANESTRTREVLLTTPDGLTRSCVDSDASTGPISPQSTARLQLPLVPGPCAVSVTDNVLPPARLTVGPERDSSQQDLLQP
jgi:hypothetical protein